MKGNKKVVEVLNDVLSAELVGINQYFVHAKMCKNWGFERIADVDYHESIDEMKHAEKLVERILFLEGVPNLQKLGRIRVGQTVPEQLKLDLELEVDAVQRLNQRDRALHRRGRQHLARPPRGHPRERREAPRLARDAARL